MITPTDLRVKFKLDTGKYPVWPYYTTDITDYSTFHGPMLKSIYATWLEEKLTKFNASKLRETYRQESNGKDPMKWKSNFAEYYEREYSIWLENKILELYNAFGFETL